ncbi:unnamed protein product [Choristocarpus tenellus]
MSQWPPPSPAATAPDFGGITSPTPPTGHIGVHSGSRVRVDRSRHATGGDYATVDRRGNSWDCVQDGGWVGFHEGLAFELPRPMMSTNIQFSVVSFNCLLSLDSRPLAKLSVSSLAMETVSESWWVRCRGGVRVRVSAGEESRDRGPTLAAGAAEAVAGAGINGVSRVRAMKWTQMSSMKFLRLNVDGLGLMDLTPDGQLHHEVITGAMEGRGRGGAAPLVPVMAVGK